jgi:hypothetical protein
MVKDYMLTAGRTRPGGTMSVCMSTPMNSFTQLSYVAPCIGNHCSACRVVSPIIEVVAAGVEW